MKYKVVLNSYSLLEIAWKTRQERFFIVDDLL